MGYLGKRLQKACSKPAQHCQVKTQAASSLILLAPTSPELPTHVAQKLTIMQLPGVVTSLCDFLCIPLRVPQDPKQQVTNCILGYSIVEDSSG